MTLEPKKLNLNLESSNFVQHRSYMRFKYKHFCSRIDNFMTSIAIFNLET